MSRAWSILVACLLVAAVQCLAEEGKKPAEAEGHPAAAPAQEHEGPQQLTAIRLPSESLAPALRAVRALGLSAAKSAARALADNMPSSLSLSSSTVNTLALAGAVVVGVVGVGALIGLLGMFGFRPCNLLGNCETYTGHAYLSPAALDAYAYSQPMYQPAVATYAKSYDGATNELPYAYDPYQTAQGVTYPSSNSVAPNAYQKRSLEYVGPILKMLSNAYEKYNHPGQSKSIEKATAATTETKSE